MNIDDENRRIYGMLYDDLNAKGYFKADTEKRREIWHQVIDEQMNIRGAI